MGETPTNCDNRGRSTVTLNFHIFIFFGQTQSYKRKGVKVVIFIPLRFCTFISYIHVMTTDGWFIFYVNGQDVSTVSTRQTFRTNESTSKESTGSISDSTSTFGTINRVHFGLNNFEEVVISCTRDK